MEKLNGKLSEINKTKFFSTQTMDNILSKKEIEELNLSRELTDDFTRDYTTDLQSDIARTIAVDESPVVSYKRDETSQHEQERIYEKTNLINSSEVTFKNIEPSSEYNANNFTNETMDETNPEITSKTVFHDQMKAEIKEELGYDIRKPEYLNPILKSEPTKDNLVSDMDSTQADIEFEPPNMFTENKTKYFTREVPTFEQQNQSSYERTYDSFNSQKTFEKRNNLNNNKEPDNTRYTFERDLTIDGKPIPLYNPEPPKHQKDVTLATVKLNKKAITEAFEAQKAGTNIIDNNATNYYSKGNNKEETMKLKRIFKKRNKKDILKESMKEINYDDSIKFRRSEKNNARRLVEEAREEVRPEMNLNSNIEQSGHDEVYTPISSLEDETRAIKKDIKIPFEQTYSFDTAELDREILKNIDKENIEIQSMKEIKKEPYFVSERELRKQKINQLRDSIRESIIIPDKLKDKMSKDSIASQLSFYNSLKESTPRGHSPKVDNSLHDKVFIGDYDRIWNKTQQDPARKKIISGLYGNNLNKKEDGPVTNPASRDYEQKVNSKKPKEGIYYRVEDQNNQQPRQKNVNKQNNFNNANDYRDRITQPNTFKPKMANKPKKVVKNPKNSYNDNKFYVDNNDISDTIVPKSDPRNAGKFFFDDED
ncbi:hypothetical protein [Spiroplasma endosymbiont of Amphibalanus improvisus]|uniref:hypothetical protein n=1 Tax=Spiroplasma endosymbiont of Amphibalanus improvisus TaxID=3066327 RepID=UPI00313D181C